MYCPKCGTFNNDFVKYCYKCGNQLKFDNNENQNQNGFDPNVNNQNGFNQNGFNQNGYNQNGYNQNNFNQNYNPYSQNNYNYYNEPYAGFWKRVAAYLIDGVIIYIVSVMINIILVVALGINTALLSSFANNYSFAESSIPAELVTYYLVAILINVIISWLYFALMESSSKQGTIGKLAVGIKVTDYDGNKISFIRATGRYFGKIISSFILGIGFLMAGFTERKQALHDYLASTYVVNK